MGLGKKQSLTKELGSETVDVMRSIKRALDPHWLMNPGKIFEPSRDDSPLDSPKATAASSLERRKAERKLAEAHS